MSRTKGFYTLKQVAYALDMTPEGVKKALDKQGLTMVKRDREWYIDPAEFHRSERFSNVEISELPKQNKQKPLSTVEVKKGENSPNLAQENKHLKEIIGLKDQQITRLETDKEQWKDQAQKLLLLPPADNKQKATPMLLVAVSLGFLVVIALLITLFFIR